MTTNWKAALEKAADMIESEYCSHRWPHGAGVKHCYSAFIYEALAAAPAAPEMVTFNNPTAPLSPLFSPAPAAPEGADMTPADARVLRKANLDLATESCRLQEALRWYAEGNHLLGTDGWESVSGEPENWLASPNADEPAMVEDGFTAREALAPFSVEPDAEPPAQGPST
jgi:hypothetical protein